MRLYLALGAAGFNLLLLQVWFVRELASSLVASELVILLVLLGYFAGLSLGYALAERIPPRLVPWGLVLAAGLHLPMVPLLRLLAVRLDQSMAALVAAVAVTALGLTAFYSILLPQAIRRTGSLKACYSAELAGGLAALTALLAFPQLLNHAPWLYQGVLLALAALLAAPPPALAAMAVVSLMVLALLPRLDTASSLAYYANLFPRLEGAKRLLNVHSPYQKIEVLEAADGRALFLNGLEYFNTSDLEAFNLYLSEVPARLKPRPKTLVVGSGSMSSVGRLAPFASEVTTVEIDPAVARVGRDFFADYNRLDRLKIPWRLVIDDAKHYLATTEERYDLIVVDVPAPYYLQTGMLFTQEFYALCRDRLTPQGVLSVYLTEDVFAGDKNVYGGPILAALHATFPHVSVVYGDEAGYSFAYASRQPLTTQQVWQACKEAGGVQYQVMLDEQMRQVSAEHAPARFADLRLVWRLAADR